ncbi:LysR family transcriptional regulator [Streptomyces odontomachi]|uniref:LysR family transcriptional regulator n=1 Tax=Streptomyces odontomachi TaxID=2944940 RepID=UPI00210C4157|nr:LysR family transcriptional regulator [Streptomyces sp. ODS25]
MELRQLEYFVAVAEEAHFTRAAERVHISQSGVSAQIRQLEQELGAMLIDRSGRSARLTPAGTAALGHARAALASAAALRQAVDEVNGLIRGRLVVGMVTACTITPLFDALSAFRQDHPGVEITLHEDTSDRLVERLRAGTLDLALIGTAEATPKGLEAYEIVRERLVVAVPPGHPLGERSRVRLADLGAHPLVSLPTGTGVRAVFDQACATRGIRPDIACQASAPTAVADLAIRGLGAAVLTESMVTQHEPLLTARRIEDVDAAALLSLAWRQSANPALRQLIRHCRRAFATPATWPETVPT